MQGYFNDSSLSGTSIYEIGSIGTVLNIRGLTGLTGDSVLKNTGYKEFNNYGFRNGNKMTCPASGWYIISCVLFHPRYELVGAGSQSGLGNFTVGILFYNGLTPGTQVEHSYQDSTMNTPDTCSYYGTIYLVKDDIFEFRYEASNLASEDMLVRISIIRYT